MALLLSQPTHLCAQPSGAPPDTNPPEISPDPLPETPDLIFFIIIRLSFAIFVRWKILHYIAGVTALVRVTWAIILIKIVKVIT